MDALVVENLCSRRLRSSCEALLDDLADWSLHVLAVRGDHLALYHFAAIGEDGRDIKNHVGFADGLTGETTVSDVDRVEDALNQLDTRWRSAISTDVAATAVVIGSNADAFLTGDAELWRSGVSDDFECRDHRPGRGGSIGADDMMAFCGVANAEVDHAVTRIVHRENERGRLTLSQGYAVVAGRFETRHDHLTIVTINSGSVSRWEMFGVRRSGDGRGSIF